MQNWRKFEGLVAAPFAPFDSKGSVCPDLIPEYYSMLESNGVSGAFINGSTGEGPSLTVKEKESIAARWAACLKDGGKVRVINLVGGTSIGECRDAAVFSAEAGLSAIAVLAPYYFKPSGVKELAGFVARVGEAVPGMPVYFYHIPVLTGVNIPMASFLPLIAPMLPNFAGIKYTHEDFMDFLACLRYNNGEFDLLWGRDECMLSALALGCRGAVGSTYNYAAPLYLALIRAFYKGDLELARELQEKSVRMISLLGKYGGMATGKAFMKYIGLDCGGYRLPVKDFDPGEYAAFSEDLRKLGIDELLSKI